MPTQRRLWEIPLRSEWPGVVHTACGQLFKNSIPVIEVSSKKMIAIFAYGITRKQDYYEVIQTVRVIVHDHNEPIKKASAAKKSPAKKTQQQLKDQRNATQTTDHPECRDPSFSL